MNSKKLDKEIGDDIILKVLLLIVNISEERKESEIIKADIGELDNNVKVVISEFDKINVFLIDKVEFNGKVLFSGIIEVVKEKFSKGNDVGFCKSVYCKDV